MKKLLKQLMAVVLVFSMIISMGTISKNASAAAKMELSSSKVTVKVGETKEVTLKNSPKGTKVSNEKQAVMPAVVTLDRGSIMGYNDNGIYAFKGVSYGTYDRFKYATATKAYGTAERPSFALTNGSVSPQSNTQTKYSNWAAAAAFMTPSESDMFSTESECLNLNVWTSSLNKKAKKPVLVFMHGGGLQNGGALELKTYDGKYFADYTNCVFVSVNARLNYVGYLDLTAIGGDANLGVADMTLSLKWVKDNISKFGGDPSNVTIMGQSGGGTKVSALASAPAAQGLFSKVVNASGGSASGVTPETAAKTANTLADYVRSNIKDMKNATDKQVFQYLQNADYDELVDICTVAKVSYGLTTGSPYFQSNFYDEDGSLNDIASQYTYMIGSVWAEMGGHNSADAVLGDWGQGGAKPNDAKGNISMEQREKIMKTQLGDNYDKASKLFKKAYPGHDIYDLRSLVSFAGMNMTASAAKSAPAVYEYLVAYEMPYFGGMTMTHTGDLGFWFHSIDSVAYQIEGDEVNAHKLADTMASALAAFCATGNPSTPKLTWKPYTTDAPRTMVFDDKSVCKDSTYDDALQKILQ
ncbi:carboxylesterase family protein [Anaerocolumna xylanovorans]|uniref:Carboxylic ester hydrolase n=1 Tax=Anaerocolumna xylanovorans DSM 12503 TaxID=1121345 RepID=A0A1M7Y0R9_9FIRM|nr:carboxylesterase family protein [Anaerocolumna xylanovorans]SHO45289.1 para-nitrobenzyl esterase [Anaerocolumna xylanovorans DSM 12503]